MARKPKMPKERNAGVVQLIKRAGAGAGAHGKTNKALRRAEKVKSTFLKKKLDNQDTLVYNCSIETKKENHND